MRLMIGNQEINSKPIDKELYKLLLGSGIQNTLCASRRLRSFAAQVWEKISGPELSFPELELMAETQAVSFSRVIPHYVLLEALLSETQEVSDFVAQSESKFVDSPSMGNLVLSVDLFADQLIGVASEEVYGKYYDLAWQQLVWLHENWAKQEKAELISLRKGFSQTECYYENTRDSYERGIAAMAMKDLSLELAQVRVDHESILAVREQAIESIRIRRERNMRRKAERNERREARATRRVELNDRCLSLVAI